MPRPPVLIIGGGIAGLSAAIRLAEHRVPVTLLETRKKLGGRATSFADVRSGDLLDNCQHVVLGCCTSYLDLLKRLHADDCVQWYDRQHWVEAGGRVSVIRPGILPAPLHYAGATLLAPFLSVSDLGDLAIACAEMLRVDRSQHQDETFGAYLRRLDQPESLMRRFWSPVVVSACNLDVDRVSASVALHVFQEAFLSSAQAAQIGVPSVPLVQLYDHAETVIRAAGGRLVLGAGVSQVDERGATTTGGERFDVGPDGRVICAVPVERVNRIVDASIRERDPRFAPLDSFTHSPILGVHLKFEAPVFHYPHAVLVDRPTQWLFRKDYFGAYIHAVISAADEWVPLTEEQIAQRVLADIHACFPESAKTRLVSARAVKEKLATFAPVPSLERKRPKATDPASTIILAGDYTQTGWPATMEGATRSGYTAAAAVLGLDPEELLSPPLEPGVLARFLGLAPPQG